MSTCVHDLLVPRASCQTRPICIINGPKMEESDLIDNYGIMKRYVPRIMRQNEDVPDAKDHYVTR